MSNIKILTPSMDYTKKYQFIQWVKAGVNNNEMINKINEYNWKVLVPFNMHTMTNTQQLNALREVIQFKGFFDIFTDVNEFLND